MMGNTGNSHTNGSVPSTYQDDSDDETPRLTVVPMDEDEPVLDTTAQDVVLQDCTEVVDSVGASTQTYYKFKLKLSGYSTTKRPDIGEGDPVELVYSAGQTTVPLYGGEPTGDGELATVSGYVDDQRVYRWTVVTQKMPQDNPIDAVHKISEP
jgi:hypothetical protein